MQKEKDTPVIRKILVPVDFSEGSINALQFAASIAARHNAVVHLLHVIDNDYDLFETGYRLKPLRFRETIQQLGTISMSVINEQQVKCFYTTEYGSVTHHILKTAVNLTAELIVMGKNGSNGLLEAYAGTHCTQVAEKTKIPLLIVPGNIKQYTIENIFLLAGTLPGSRMRAALINLLASPANTVITPAPAELPCDSSVPTEGTNPAVGLQVEREAFDLVIVSTVAANAPVHTNPGYYPQKIIHSAAVPVLVLNE